MTKSRLYVPIFWPNKITNHKQTSKARKFMQEKQFTFGEDTKKQFKKIIISSRPSNHKNAGIIYVTWRTKNHTNQIFEWGPLFFTKEYEEKNQSANFFCSAFF